MLSFAFSVVELWIILHALTIFILYNFNNIKVFLPKNAPTIFPNAGKTENVPGFEFERF